MIILKLNLGLNSSSNWKLLTISFIKNVNIYFLCLHIWSTIVKLNDSDTKTVYSISK